MLESHQVYLNPVPPLALCLRWSSDLCCRLPSAPSPATPVRPPWMNAIILSHLGCKWDLLLSPPLLGPPCSNIVRLHPGHWGHCLCYGHPPSPFRHGVALLLLLPDIYQRISFRNNSCKTAFSLPRVPEMINGNSYTLMMTDTGKVRQTHKKPPINLRTATTLVLRSLEYLQSLNLNLPFTFSKASHLKPLLRFSCVPILWK